MMHALSMACLTRPSSPWSSEKVHKQSDRHESDRTFAGMENAELVNARGGYQ